VIDAKLDALYGQHLQTLMSRTQRALASLGFDALVVHSGVPPTQFLDDQDYPYKVNPHFKAWVPVVDNPHCFLIYAPGNAPKLLFFQANDYWHQAVALPRLKWTEAVEIVSIGSPADAPPHWNKLGRAAFIGPAPVFGELDPLAVNPADLLTQLHYDRAVKTAYELECLRRANGIAVRGHRAALAAFRDGASEYTAHMRYLQACEQREEEMPYNNIVAYNEHAAVLHYQHLDRGVARPLRSFLIDAGAQFRGYAADITRTYAASSGAFADLVAATEEAQLLLCEEIVAGRDYREVHLTAHRILGNVMQRLGLISVPGDAAVELGLTRVFFPHGIGHLLGLQVHDVGGVLADSRGEERKRPEGHPYLRLTRMLEPGVVVTVEPGLYFIDSLLAAAHGDGRRAYIAWDKVEALRPFGGIRIEDNVVTTQGSPENLTRDAFAELAAAA
jgi:Xaa-Pro dipeptidase